jgi:hypothetical protein
MSAKTEKALRNWERAPDNDFIYVHFSEYERWDWCEVSEEGCRVWNIMFDEDVEAQSPADGVFGAMCACSAKGAIKAVAAALGVDAESLQNAVAEWYDNQDQLPPPVGAMRLMELCRANQQK